MKKTTQLKRMISSPDLAFLMEAHNGLSAKIVEESGFAGIWGSGLSISASLGMRDNNEASWTQVVDVLEYMSDATRIPILMDGDTGFGNFNNARRLVTKLEKVGVAGVCIEDKQFPKTNSFLSNSAESLADIGEFCGKIAAMKDVQRDTDFVVVARLESFIAGLPLEDALSRAHSYAQAGADALLVHSKRADARDIDAFIGAFGVDIPIIIVPTKYYTVPTAHYRTLGVSTVIWANHNCRAAIAAMQQTCRQIFAEESLLGVEDRIASVSEVFRIQGNDELEMAEKRYLPQGTADTNAIILAATRGHAIDELTLDKPKTMIKVNEKTLLETQIDMLEEYGIGNVTVVRGYKKENVRVDGHAVRFVDNDAYQDTSVVYSLALALDAFDKQVLVTYGDLLFKKHLIYDVLSRNQEVCIVTNRNEKTDMYDTYVYADESVELMDYNQKLCVRLVASDAPDVTSPHFCGNFIGILSIRGSAVPRVRKLLRDIVDGREHWLTMQAFLGRLLRAGIDIGIVIADENDWVDINTLSDIENALSRR